jgi:hypothetical protein
MIDEPMDLNKSYIEVTTSKEVIARILECERVANDEQLLDLIWDHREELIAWARDERTDADEIRESLNRLKAWAKTRGYQEETR